MKQLTVFGDEIELKRSVSAEAKAKKNFLARFQRWCDAKAKLNIPLLEYVDGV